MLDARVEQAKKKSWNSRTMKMLRERVKIRANARWSTRTGKVFTDGAQSGCPASGKATMEMPRIYLFERSWGQSSAFELLWTRVRRNLPACRVGLRGIFGSCGRGSYRMSGSIHEGVP